MACYLASVAPHSGDWLLALPMSKSGMQLGLTLCVPHKCHCGSDVDARADMPWSARRHLAGLQDTKCSTT